MLRSFRGEQWVVLGPPVGLFLFLFQLINTVAPHPSNLREVELVILCIYHNCILIKVKRKLHVCKRFDPDFVNSFFFFLDVVSVREE